MKTTTCFVFNLFNQHCLEKVTLVFMKLFIFQLLLTSLWTLIVLDVQLAKDMSTAAVRTIRKEIKDLYINIQSLQEKDKACGNGNGIMWVQQISYHPPQLFWGFVWLMSVHFLSLGRIIAESSTGCIFAGSSLGKKGKGCLAAQSWRISSVL